MNHSLSIVDLHVSVSGQEIVRGVSLECKPGEIHAIMGPNGSGKSTLVNFLMGHPSYDYVSGSVTFMGQDLLALDPHERSLLGLFLAFQYPKELTGIPLRQFLLAAHRAHFGETSARLSPLQFSRELERLMNELSIDPQFADRSINKGFSGGEKKKAEVLQMSLLRPRLALLDETDSGLDVDALRIVAEGVNRLRGPEFSSLIVTHYARILEYITPDAVHVMSGGRIIKSGGGDLAFAIEKDGYAQFGITEA